MRITASWSGSLGPTEYKDAARYVVRDTRAPPQIIIPTRPSVPSCSEPSRPSLAVAAEGRPALTAPARAGVSIVLGRGEETGFQIEQRNSEVKKIDSPPVEPS
jgi:hypothetical protein